MWKKGSYILFVSDRINICSELLKKCISNFVFMTKCLIDIWKKYIAFFWLLRIFTDKFDQDKKCTRDFLFFMKNRRNRGTDRNKCTLTLWEYSPAMAVVVLVPIQARHKAKTGRVAYVAYGNIGNRTHAPHGSAGIGWLQPHRLHVQHSRVQGVMRLWVEVGSNIFPNCCVPGRHFAGSNGLQI